jgi:hypothetical protein
MGAGKRLSMVGNKAWETEIKKWIETDYPNLKSNGYEITSPDTIDYNCVAWAMQETDTWWWPNPESESYWPPNVPRQETLEAFIQAFATLGYQVCENYELETDFQKIAIYVLKKKPTHVARQLDDGKWTSKLGSNEDIIHHNLDGLEGEKYGKVTTVMKRKIKNDEKLLIDSA